ncbi:MAG: zinc-binding dehydrogenase [Candidatus Helarchaeota archaeon]|nr:zinc-binding dehydrogenase [Candidatus Helarchaeota archaeon]
MRAAIFEDVRKIIYREDYPKPTVSPDYTIVKVSYCGICGSDVSNYKYSHYQTPIIMGHEFSAEITEIGENVSRLGFKIGDKVTGINPVIDIDKDVPRHIGIIKDGAFAEFVKIHKNYLYKIPENVSLEEATLIESFAAIIRALKLSKITKNQKIMIIGGGNMGLATLNVLMGEKDPEYVMVVEPHEFLREKAKELGANITLPPSRVKINKYFRKNGKPTFVFECVGNEQALMMAIDSIKKGGTIVLEGVQREKITFPIFSMTIKEICMIGTWGHDKEDIKTTLDLFAKNKVKASEFISKIIPLKDIQSGFEEYLQPGERKFIKILVKI